MYWRTLKEGLTIAYRRIGALAALNAAFVVASLPIVTLPATIPMLSAAVRSIARDERPSWRAEWGRAGRYFLRGGLTLLAVVAVTTLLVLDLFILDRMRAVQRGLAYLLMGFVLCLLMLWLLMQIYLLPLLIAEDLAVLRAFRKALFLVLGNFALSATFGATMAGAALLLLLSGVGPFVIMASFLVLLQHLLVKNLMERYDEEL